MKVRTKRTLTQVVWRLLFLLYCGMMLWLLFGQRMGGNVTSVENLNLEPLRTLKMYVRIMQHTESAELLRHAFINLAGNVLMFIPFGFFLPVIWRKQNKLFACISTAVLCIVAVETLQYFTNLGSCDIDDLILNLLGVLMGWLLKRIIPLKSQ